MFPKPENCITVSAHGSCDHLGSAHSDLRQDGPCSVELYIPLEVISRVNQQLVLPDDSIDLRTIQPEVVGKCLESQAAGVGGTCQHKCVLIKARVGSVYKYEMQDDRDLRHAIKFCPEPVIELV